LTELLHQFSDWYLSTLAQGGYGLIAALMALESTFVPIPSEVIIPPAAYLAHTQGQFSILGVVLAGTVGSWVGASVMYWGARLLGRPLIVRFGRYVGLGQAKIELAERWCAHYGPPGVFFSRLLPVIRHLIGIPTGILQMDFRRYALATLAGSLLWCSVLAWLGVEVGSNRELLLGSVHRFSLLVFAIAAVLAALYYFFVQRPSSRLGPPR
jgi:membrane protein DedA with SNARE-associated domain